MSRAHHWPSDDRRPQPPQQQQQHQFQQQRQAAAPYPGGLDGGMYGVPPRPGIWGASPGSFGMAQQPRDANSMRQMGGPQSMGGPQAMSGSPPPPPPPSPGLATQEWPALGAGMSPQVQMQQKHLRERERLQWQQMQMQIQMQMQAQMQMQMQMQMQRLHEQPGAAPSGSAAAASTSTTSRAASSFAIPAAAAPIQCLPSPATLEEFVKRNFLYSSLHRIPLALVHRNFNAHLGGSASQEAVSMDQLIGLLRSVSQPYLTLWTRMQPITPDIGLCIIGRPHVPSAPSLPLVFPFSNAIPPLQPCMQLTPPPFPGAISPMPMAMSPMYNMLAQQLHAEQAMAQHTRAQQAMLAQQHQQDADADAEDSLPPDDLLFSPAAHAQYRKVWEELLATELESAHAHLCKANRDGIEISCSDPLKTKAAPTLDADFAYVPIKTQSNAPFSAHPAFSSTRSAQGSSNGLQPQQQQRENGADDSEHKEQKESVEARALSPEEADAAAAEEAAEVAIASRYQNPLADSRSPFDASGSGGGVVVDGFDFDQVEEDDDTQHLHLSAAESSRSSACERTSAFWRWPHPPRRVFNVRNTHSFPLVLSVRFLALQLQRHAARQFTLHTASGLPLSERSRVVIEPDAAVEVVAQAGPGEDVGLVTQFLLFDLEFPALWSRATRAPAGEASGAAASTPALASSLLSYEVKHLTIVRALKAINSDPATMRVLSRESKPYFPLSLRLSFDVPAAHTLSAQPPVLPQSFLRLQAQLPTYELPEGLDVLHARRAALAVGSAPEAAQEAARAFQAAWSAHVEQVKAQWIEARDYYDALEDDDGDEQDEYDDGWGGQREGQQRAQFDQFGNRISSPRRLDASQSSSSVQRGRSAETLALRARVRTHLCNQHIGLHAEELQMGLDVRSYDLYYTRLQPAPPPPHRRGARDQPELGGTSQHEFVLLHVPGVAERRPALSLGDRVELRVADQDQDASAAASEANSLCVHAFVHSVREETVQLTFPLSELASALGHGHGDEDDAPGAGAGAAATAMLRTRLFHVRFGYDRLSFRYLYRALFAQLASPHVARFLFPSSQDALPLTAVQGAVRPRELPRLDPVDANLNFEQLTAVQHVVANSHGAAPFVIFGPPGTGKTLTVVELILQLLRRDDLHSRGFGNDNASTGPTRILVVAPSNFAADVIVERLAPHVSPLHMLRLNSYQRHTAVRPAAQPYLCFDADAPSMYGLPNLYQLMQCRVVVMTCVAAGCLVDLGMPAFSHIIFDESCQALEAEAFVPLQLADAHTAVVLAGDPLQLGAEVHSSVAKALGLHVSWQERLLRTDLYRESLALPVHATTSPPYGSRSGANGSAPAAAPHVAIQLTKNYRSHRKLLAVSSALFYEGSLQPYASPATTRALEHWEHLPNQSGFPLLFYGVRGRDVFEQSHSSFYNVDEAAKCVQLIDQLLTSQAVPGLSTNDIGVIAPYRKQVVILRQLLRARGLGAIRVGSVDDNQGSEEKIMIISTVVSRARGFFAEGGDGADGRSAATLPLGILRNARRFNVALSRAKALTIVVGNPDMLAGEDNWRELLVYAIENGAYAGCACSAQREVAAKKVLGGGVGGDAKERMRAAAASSASAEQCHSDAPDDNDRAAVGAQLGLAVRHHASLGRAVRAAADHDGDGDFDHEEEEQDEWDEEVDPDDVVWEEGNPFFDGAWRVML